MTGVGGAVVVDALQLTATSVAPLLASEFVEQVPLLVSTEYPSVRQLYSGTTYTCP